MHTQLSLFSRSEKSAAAPILRGNWSLVPVRVEPTTERRAGTARRGSVRMERDSTC
jgi:hypothetical protein